MAGRIELPLQYVFLYLRVKPRTHVGEQVCPVVTGRTIGVPVAFTFGLLHGFGFAGALAEIGLPKGNLIGALFLFNVGIEVGQLLVIAIGLSIAWIARRGWFTAPQFLVRAPLYLVGCTAAYWVVERSAGIIS